MKSLTGGCPCVRLDHIEARGYHLVAEMTYRPLVGRDDRMIELLEDVTFEEADQQGTPWPPGTDHTAMYHLLDHG